MHFARCHIFLHCMFTCSWDNLSCGHICLCKCLLIWTSLKYCDLVKLRKLEILISVCMPNCVASFKSRLNLNQITKCPIFPNRNHFQKQLQSLSPYTNDKFDSSKLKEFGEDNFNFDENGRMLCKG